jgi:hypothetical protein
MMRSGFVCLLPYFSCALTASAQSATLSPKDAAAYWHQKKDWNNVQASPVISGAAEGQSIADYWHSTHANPNFICATCSSSTAPAGTIFSGSYPVIGANVYLFAAATGGYGTPNNPVASISLLTNGVQDANGNYSVVTDVNGNFYINGNVTCTPNQQLYAYAVGGSINPSLSLNGNIGEMAVIGPCPSMYSPVWPPPVGAFPFISMTPVTTVAAAYALAGFALDATDISSSNTPLAQVGVANAFANAANLASISTGLALTTTPSGNGAVPQSTIDTLANILASCIDSVDPISIQCSALFNQVAPNGNPTGAPMDTATAAIYMAQNPGVNVSALFGFSNAANQYPYSPALAIQPNDFTVGIDFTGGGLNDGLAIAIDGVGNVWVVNSDSSNPAISSVTEMSSLGTFVPGSPFTDMSLEDADGIAIDAIGNAWIPDEVLVGGDSLTEITSAGLAYQKSSTYLSAPIGVTIDSSGNIWADDFATNSVTEFDGNFNFKMIDSGVTPSPYGMAADSLGNVWVVGYQSTVTKIKSSGLATTFNGGGTLDGPYNVAIDGSNNVWIDNVNSATVTKLANDGSLLAVYSGHGLYAPYWVAIDGAGNAWVPNLFGSTITEISNTGAFLSGSNGYSISDLSYPLACAVDGSGDVWITDSFSGKIRELIGAAAPVVTPLATGAATGTLGGRP